MVNFDTIVSSIVDDPGSVTSVRRGVQDFLSGRGDGVRRVAVPSYFWPTYYNAPEGNHDWERLQAGGPHVAIACCNPSSGPGEAVNADWVVQIQRAQAAGLKILGYIRTNYTAFTAASVLAQADLYYEWYAVDGILLDETAPEAEHVPYYAGLYAALKGRGLVVINPGQPWFDEALMGACDIAMTFENTPTAYAAMEFPTWSLKYPASRFWHVIHSVADTTERDAVLAAAVTNRAGNIYLTTAELPNPYGALPADPFWSGSIPST